ncbi:MAG: FMN-binding protein [Candidatus Ornithospirochaeta sp.]
MKKRRLIPLLLMLFFFLCAVSCVLFMGSGMKKEVQELDETEVVPLSAVKDGTYTASAETTLVKAEVSVTVKDHTFVSISILRHDNGKGKDAERIVCDMVAENSSEVDIIAGATASSKVIRAAVRKALLQGV